MSQKSFLDNKKSRKIFPYVGGGGNQHMENSICFVVFIFESFPFKKINSNFTLHIVLFNSRKWDTEVRKVEKSGEENILVMKQYPIQIFYRSLLQ